MVTGKDLSLYASPCTTLIGFKYCFRAVAIFIIGWKMKNNLVAQIIELRFLVGFLGEKNQAHWWSSHFISRSSDAFLLPVYPRTTLLSQYYGVCEAALLVHDEHIGVGNTYHLYRLPNSIERAVAESIRDNNDHSTLKNKLLSADTALVALQVLSHASVEKTEGPVAVGIFQDASLESLLAESAAHYLQAFRENYQCFPFMRQV
jgi:hypothetical protein